MDVGQVSFKDARKVRRVLVAARENPIVNRLNRTRVEKRPDLKQLRDERLAELRRRDQAAAQTRVRGRKPKPPLIRLTFGNRERRRRGRRRSGRRRSGQRTMRTTTCLPRRIWRGRVIAIAGRIGKMTLCDDTYYALG